MEYQIIAGLILILWILFAVQTYKDYYSLGLSMLIGALATFITIAGCVIFMGLVLITFGWI